MGWKQGQKIFCVGLNKTGTTSLQAAFQRLGLRAFHDAHKAKRLIKIAEKKRLPLLTFTDDYDAYTDHPFFQYYRQLDSQYANSFFILNTRSLSTWLNSRDRHDNTFGNQGRRQKNIKEYCEVHSAIATYFKNSNHFLIIDVCAGQGYETLCPFLGLPIIDEPFPHLRKSL